MRAADSAADRASQGSECGSVRENGRRGKWEEHFWFGNTKSHLLSRIGVGGSKVARFLGYASVVRADTSRRVQKIDGSIFPSSLAQFSLGWHVCTNTRTAAAFRACTLFSGVYLVLTAAWKVSLVPKQVARNIRLETRSKRNFRPTRKRTGGCPKILLFHRNVKREHVKICKFSTAREFRKI